MSLHDHCDSEAKYYPNLESGSVIQPKRYSTTQEPIVVTEESISTRENYESILQEDRDNTLRPKEFSGDYKDKATPKRFNDYQATPKESSVDDILPQIKPDVECDSIDKLPVEPSLQENVELTAWYENYVMKIRLEDGYYYDSILESIPDPNLSTVDDWLKEKEGPIFVPRGSPSVESITDNDPDSVHFDDEAVTDDENVKDPMINVLPNDIDLDAISDDSMVDIPPKDLSDLEIENCDLIVLENDIFSSRKDFDIDRYLKENGYYSVIESLQDEADSLRNKGKPHLSANIRRNKRKRRSQILRERRRSKIQKGVVYESDDENSNPKPATSKNARKRHNRKNRAKKIQMRLQAL